MKANERTRETVEEELRLLMLQINAVFESDMLARDRRIILEGYANKKDELDRELKSIEMSSKEILDIEVTSETVLAGQPEQRKKD